MAEQLRLDMSSAPLPLSWICSVNEWVVFSGWRMARRLIPPFAMHDDK